MKKNTLQLQNNDKAIQMLAAQRNIYSNAKRIKSLITVLIVVFVPIFSLVALRYTHLAPYSAIFSIAVLAINGILGILLTNMKAKAASIQELFDEYVLGIETNDLIITQTDLTEDIEEYGNAELKKRGKQKLLDWYPKSLSSKTTNGLQVSAQKINSWWDYRLRNSYTIFMAILSVLIVLGLFVLGLIVDLKLSEFVLIVIVPAVPLLQLAFSEIVANYQSAKKASSNLAQANFLLKNLSLPNIDTRVRALQDAIYLHRSSAPMILDFIYWVSRDKKEGLMKQIAKRMHKK